MANGGGSDAVAGDLIKTCVATDSTPQSRHEIDTYNPCLAARMNAGQTFSDQHLSSIVDNTNHVDLTTSTALAGAVASLRVNGKEFIASGGHGSALQYALHDDTRGECFNPTEAGNKADDNQPGWPAPFHGPSTSKLLSTTSDGSTLTTQSIMAMYVPSGLTSDFDGCVAHYPKASAFVNGLSPYMITKTISLGTTATADLNNVLRFDATVSAQGSTLITNYDALQIAYLQDNFTQFYTLNTTTGTAAVITDDKFRATSGAGYASGSTPIIAATPDGTSAIGIYTPGAKNVANDESVLYSAGRNDGSGPYAFVNHTIQVTYYAHNVGDGKTSYTTYFVVGNLQRVTHDMSALAGRLQTS